MDWNDLVDRSKDNHIFLTLEWLATWWKYFNAGRKLHLLAIKDKDRILAVAPLMDSTYRFFGVRLRRIEFIGSPMSDYHSFVLTTKGLECTKLFLDSLNNLTWDCIELRSIPESSETANALRAVSQQSFKLKERVLDLCPFVPLPGTIDEYFQSLSPRMRQNLRRRERNLRREHKVEFLSYTKVADLDRAMRVFFELHQQRQQSKGYLGKFSDQVLRDFHLEVAKRFAEKGWLRLYFLIIDDKPASVEYSFKYNQSLHAYLSGFDPRYSRYGVGHITIVHAIERSIRRGSEEFDFMRGDHSYKNRFNALIRKNIEFSAVRRRPAPIFYDWLVRGDRTSSLAEKLRNYVRLS